MEPLEKPKLPACLSIYFKRSGRRNYSLSMKPLFKHLLIIISGIVGALIALTLALHIFLFGNQASTPKEIARKAGLKLPAYEITKAEDNMDRTASAWSYYGYEIKFKEPLSEKYLERIEKMKNCTRKGDIYIVADESPDSWSCHISINPTENIAILEYSFWDALF